jgi:hypothetical protein
MKRIYQNKFNTDGVRGNCFAAVIASIMDKDSPDDVIQIQEHYSEDWITILCNWLQERGYEWISLNGHSTVKDEFYLVIGKSPRDESIKHVCIYQNGKLYHDPHPDGRGLLSEDRFELLTQLKTNEEEKK